MPKHLKFPLEAPNTQLVLKSLLWSYDIFGFFRWFVLTRIHVRFAPCL